MKTFLAAAAIALTVAATPAVAHADCTSVVNNLVKNCSFENPDIVNGAVYPTAPLNDWTANPVGVVERWTNSFGGFGAKHGKSHVELKVDQTTSLWQNIGTVSGNTYTLKYSAAHRVNGTNRSQIDVYFGAFGVGTTLIASTANMLVNGFQWYDFETTFVAGADNGVIEFRSMGSHRTYGDHLDNVSVALSASPTAVVPEPSTYAMMAIGLGGLFAARRRRQR